MQSQEIVILSLFQVSEHTTTLIIFGGALIQVIVPALEPLHAWYQGLVGVLC